MTNTTGSTLSQSAHPRTYHFFRRININSDEFAPAKPFLSVLLIISTLFGLVFLQMEERRMGYALLKLTREQRKVIEERRQKSIQLAKITRPEHVEKLAQSRMTLRKVQANQIIHLTGPQENLHNRDVN